MSSTPTQAGSSRRTNPPGGQKPSIVLPAAIVGLLIVGGAVAYKMKQSPPPPPTPVETAAPVQQSSPVRPIVPREEIAEAPAAPVAVAPAPAATPAPAPAARVAPSEPSADSRQLMSSLTALDAKGPISAEDAQKWKASLQQLVRQGASSVPAIRDYLAQNFEVNYAGAPGGDQLGYSSLRAGLLDALGQIGGPDSTTAMLQIMQSSVYPTDIAALATTLQQQAPGQYDADIMTAIRAQLSQASQDQLGEANVGPLFQLLASEGANGTDVSADLTQYATKWPYYSAIELASLPNGQGVASLIQVAQENQGASQTAAAQALAQLSPQNSQALSALVNLVQQGQLSDAALAQVAPYLGGRENELGAVNNPSGSTAQSLHIASGNQDFVAADVLNALTPDQITQRLAIVNQLLQTIPADDTQSQQALQQQKINLQGRQGK